MTYQFFKIRFLRRIFQTVPPGNRALLARVALLVSNLRSKQKYNKVDQECVDSVFSYALCHARDQTKASEVASMFMDVLVKNVTALFGKKVEDYSEEKDSEFPLPFLYALRSDCDLYASHLLPDVSSLSEALTKRDGVRSSRKSISVWDLSSSVNIKPITGKGDLNKLKVSPDAKEMGKMLFEGKFNAAKRFLEKKSNEFEDMKKELLEKKTIVSAKGSYTGNSIFFD